MDTRKFVESALGFTKSPLGIIALFIVLVYGFASLVVGFGSGLSEHVVPLIYFMVFFPVLVFVGFLHNKEKTLQLKKLLMKCRRRYIATQ